MNSFGIQLYARESDEPGYNARQKALFCITTLFGALAIGAVVLRFWARRLQRLQFFLSDWIVLLGLACVLGHATTILIGTVWGAGQQSRIVSQHHPQNLPRLVRLYVASSYPWLYATCFTKLGILLMYCELFPSRNFRYVCYFVMFLISVFCITQSFVIGIVCHPFARQSAQPKISTREYCPNIATEDIAAALCSTLFDIIIIGLPQPIVWRLQMASGKKAVVSLLFSFALVVVAVTVVRVYYTFHSARSSSEDPTWGMFPIILTAYLESSLTLTSACLPTLGPALHQVLEVSRTKHQSITDILYRNRSHRSAGAASSSHYSNVGAEDVSTPEDERVVVSFEDMVRGPRVEQRQYTNVLYHGVPQLPPVRLLTPYDEEAPFPYADKEMYPSMSTSMPTPSSSDRPFASILDRPPRKGRRHGSSIYYHGIPQLPTIEPVRYSWGSIFSKMEK